MHADASVSSMYASMQLADAYHSTYACSRASKQYHGSMQAAEPW